MYRNMTALLLSIVLVGALTPSLWGQDCPNADLTQDCEVGFDDLFIFGLQWLSNPGGVANLDGMGSVDMSDFVLLAADWRTEGAPPPTLVINEFMADNNNFLFDNYGDDDDWIEIYNYGSYPINIGGMYISDNYNDVDPWRIPDDASDETTIPAGGYLILWADNDEGSPSTGGQGPLHLDFGLSRGGGEDIVLLDRDRNLVDIILDFGPQGENDSYGRLPDAGAEWQVFVDDTQMPPTPGQSNGGIPPEEEIVITEIMYHPNNGQPPPAAGVMVEDIREEYLEIYNRGFSAVDLTGWRFTDGVDFTFPAVSIGPGEYLVIAADVAAFAAKYAGVQNVTGGWDGRLSNSAETIELTMSTGKVINRIRYADKGDWALRLLGPVDYFHRGWIWSDAHDGNGKSLELVSISMPNVYGPNWATSLIQHGTPGRANSATGEPVETIKLVDTGAVWSYLDDGLDPSTQWKEPDFVDGGWAFGPSELGYGDGDEATVVSYGSSASNKHMTTYFRHSFEVVDKSQLASAQIRLIRDDGAVVYLNGSELFRSNMPQGNINYLTPASSNISGGVETEFVYYSLDPDRLINGTNILAVEIHQDVVTSSDISLDLILEAIVKQEQQPEQDIAPLIVDAKHRPFIPHSTDVVTVTAEVIDEQATGVVVSVHYRPDGQGTYDTAAMLDDGQNGDVEAGDSVFTARIPAQADGVVVEFYIEAKDAGDNVRTRPALCDVDGTLTQSCNMLYQVDDSFDPDAEWQPGSQPIYYIIMTEAERAELEQIGANGSEANSDAQMNATFISVDGVDTKIRYNVGVRNRGHGTRARTPNNCRVNFSTDRPWKNVVAINLNTQYTWLQLAGSALFRRSGLATGNATAVQVRFNGQNLANSGSPQYGSYVHVESINSEYFDRHFPDNSAGNAYKCVRITSGNIEADLRYESPDANVYRNRYFKSTNVSQDDWSDLIDLTLALSDNTSDDIYVQEVNRTVNVNQWLRFLALNILLRNGETSFAIGSGDDYYLYRGDRDTRAVLIQHDLDSIFGRGQSSRNWPADDLFPFMSGSYYSPIAALLRMVSHPEFAPLYYSHLRDLTETTLSAEELGPFLDNLLGGFVPSQEIDSMASYMAARNALVLSLIPLELTVESNLFQVGDLYETDANAVTLSGYSDAVDTRSVTVNGLPAEWSAIDARWSIGEGSAAPNEEMIVTRGSTWMYLDDGSNQGTAWYAFDLDETTWESGPARLGYGGDGEVTTVDFIDTDPVTAGTQKNITTYFRHTFYVDDPSQYTNLRLSVLRDDGAVVYLNGSELWRTHMPAGAFNYTTRASQPAVGGADEHTFQLAPTLNSALLNVGKNVLAVEVHQVSSGSSDVSFDLELAGRLPTAGVITGVPVNPGITRIIVQAFDGPGGTGNEIDREYIDIWQPAAAAAAANETMNKLMEIYDNGPIVPSVPAGKSLTTIQGTLGGNTTWTVENGPHQVTGELIVPVGVTLTIEAGTTVFFDAGVQLTVYGAIRAEGAEYNLIRFTRTPTSGGTWDGIQLVDTVEDNVISHAVIEYTDVNQGSIGLVNASALLEHLTWRTGSRHRFIRARNASVIIRNCVFPDRFGPTEFPGAGDDNTVESINAIGILPGGQFIIENNIFGTNKGHNDVIDFSGPGRPGPILQVLNNIFMGCGDELLDLGGEALIEGNIFQHVHKDVWNTGSGDSNVISTGDDNFDAVITVVRNVFYDVDHAVNLKNDTYMYFEHNTVVGIPDDEGSSRYSVINFLIPNRNQQGKGAYLNGNIFRDIPKRIFDRVDEDFGGAPDFETDLVMHNCLIPAERADDIISTRLGTTMDLGQGNFTGNPLFVDPSGDFHLKAASPARKAAPGGIDLGAYAPAGAGVSGEPAPTTYRTDATLTVAGPGVTDYKYRLNGDTWSSEYPVNTPIELSLLGEGEYTVEVIGKNFIDQWQSESAPGTSQTWTIDTTYSRLVINEVLAHNFSTLDYFGTAPDLIELYYDGPAPLDLAGMSITDDPVDPTRYVFGAGVMINPGQHLVLYADSMVGTSDIHLGFAVSDRGEGVYLYDSTGGLVDSVEFGLQVVDLSIGRGNEGVWKLTQPTFGAANVVQPLGDRSGVKINEWFANGDILFVDDFIEFYNADIFPVDLGGMYITDNPVSQPEKYQFAPLSFVAGAGFADLDADAQSDPGHVPFRLSSDMEMIAVYESDSSPIDAVLYGPQTTDVSQGRTPNGAASYDFFELPTPGVANPGVSGGETFTVNLMDIEQVWSYDDSATSRNVGWRRPYWNDTLWPTGAALLYVEESSLPAPKNTPLTYGARTYYFRTHFTVDMPIDDITALAVSTVVDDGAIIYLNDAEVLRIGIDAGPISYDVFANRGVDNAVYEFFTIPTTGLVQGDNVFAVEVHQATATSSDIVWGMALDAIGETPPDNTDPLAEEKALLDSLRITELMYHPISGSDYEFVELQNIGAEELDLTGVRLAGGIEFTFGAMTLAAGEYVLVANNRVVFETFYGTGLNLAAGEYTGNLSNGGEDVILRLAAPLRAAILRFGYNDAWYPTTDGDGYSLVIRDATAHPATWDDAESWAASTSINGSAGSAD